MSGPISTFLDKNYRHFNASALVRASKAYKLHLEKGGKMMVTLAGAMSTAELGMLLAEMIRQGKVHAISCTGANLEEDIFNLVAHDYYQKLPDYRDLSPQDELDLLKKGLCRVTDTCVPEEQAMRRVGREIIQLFKDACNKGERYFPFEFFYRLIKERHLEKYYQIDPKDSWVVAACEQGLPIYTPGWEDSTTGNFLVAETLKGDLKNAYFMKSGLEQMKHLAEWYRAQSAEKSIGFFQIGGGIAGDFPICVVPMLRYDLKEQCRSWGYFCQISDSVTSYGSYSGAVPNEKITWGKLDVDTPRFVVESDATIVAPLMFAYILGM